MFDKVGAGVYSEPFAFCSFLGPFQTNSDGELETIRVAAEQIIVRTIQLTQKDCPSQPFKRFPHIINSVESKIIESYRRRRSLLASKEMVVVLQWIPDHVLITDNEWANEIHKKGLKFYN
ncbi:uncharacterized protein LOC118182472 [Stegodyphus dumicola]|uniref:uncharacterized protein LOC118182472 n=1 Tax=Stegodyphus dumicola TaxID=202533 RepID=UPI0015AA916E|nr:uncharacterized protein LOC118182472 [Stegodyphus dumicola]